MSGKMSELSLKMLQLIGNDDALLIDFIMHLIDNYNGKYLKQYCKEKKIKHGKNKYGYACNILSHYLNRPLTKQEEFFLLRVDDKEWLESNNMCMGARPYYQELIGHYN